LIPLHGLNIRICDMQQLDMSRQSTSRQNSEP
jgi:hypothetical protein